MYISIFVKKNPNAYRYLFDQKFVKRLFFQIKNVHPQSMVKIVCTTVVETVKMVLGATYRLAGVTMAVKLDLRGSVVIKV